MTDRILAIAALALAGSGVAAETGPGVAVPLWNHAYIENTQVDSIAAILAGARHAYVLIDPFQPDLQDSIAGSVAVLQGNGNQVGAYISIGTGENWRADFAALQPSLVAGEWPDWPGEYFLRVTDAAALAVMTARIDRAADWGFDWVEFDNMDWSEWDDVRATFGIEATAAEGQAFYQALCDHVHARGMKCMAKSTVTGADIFDGVTYESSPDNQYWWDDAGAQRFMEAGKLVIIVHYGETDCAAAAAAYRDHYGQRLSFICENPALGGYEHSPG